MTKVAVAGLLGRKLRAALTAIAIILGVAMVSGTYILTDTIQSAFSTVFTQANKNSDAVVSGKSAIGGNDHNGPTSTIPSVPESLLTKIRGLSGVEQASGGISDSAQLIGHNGKVISRGGAPGLAFSYSPDCLNDLSTGCRLVEVAPGPELYERSDVALALVPCENYHGCFLVPGTHLPGHLNAVKVRQVHV